MFKKSVIILAAFAALAFSLCTVSGCGPFWVNPYVTVKPSPLNWVHIRYYDMRLGAVRRTSVYLNGAGYVEIKKGKSDLVSNDFAKSYENENWDHIRTNRRNIPLDHVNDLFQHLVNCGLLDNEKYFKGGDRKVVDRCIVVKANINSISYAESDNIFESDPDLAENLLDVVREFDTFGN